MQNTRRLSSTLSKRVFTGICNPVYKSNIRCRGRSFAASVPSDTPEVKEVRKRVSKHERKAMVEYYVNKYRAANSGKFPSVSSCKKEVGGSYYVIRKIVQELEYNSKLSPKNTSNDTSVGKNVAKDNDLSTEVEEVPSSQMTVDAKIDKDAQAMNATSLVKEVADENESSSEVAEVLSSQVQVDAEIDKDAQKRNETLLVKEVAKKTESSTEVKKVLNRQMTDDEEIDKNSQTGDQILLGTVVLKESESSVKVEVVSVNEMTVDAKIHKDAPLGVINDVDSGSSSSKSSGVEEKSHTPILVQKSSKEVNKPTSMGDNPEYDARQIHLLKGEAKEALHPCPEKLNDIIKEKTPTEDMLDFGGSETKAHQQQQSPELDKFVRDLKEQTDDEALKKKSSLWGNLKSLANGIIDAWRKL